MPLRLVWTPSNIISAPAPGVDAEQMPFPRMQKLELVILANFASEFNAFRRLCKNS